MAYNMTDEEWAALSNEQLMELSEANIEVSRKIDTEMLHRGMLLTDREQQELSGSACPMYERKRL